MMLYIRLASVLVKLGRTSTISKAELPIWEASLYGQADV